MAKKLKSSRKATTRNRNKFHGARAPMNTHGPAFDLSAVIPGGKGTLRNQQPQLPAHLQGIDFKAIVEGAEAKFREGIMQAYAALDPVADMAVITLVGELTQDLLKSIQNGEVPVKEQFAAMLYTRLDAAGLNEVKAILTPDDETDNLATFFSAFSRESLQMVKNMQASVQSQAKPIAEQDLPAVAKAAMDEALPAFRMAMMELLFEHFPGTTGEQMKYVTDVIAGTLPDFTQDADDSIAPEVVEQRVIAALDATHMAPVDEQGKVTDLAAEMYMNDFWNVYEDALGDYVEHIRTELGLNDFDGARVETPEANVVIGEDGVPTIVETGEGVHDFAQAIIDSGIDLDLNPLGLPDGEQVTLTQEQKDNLFNTAVTKATYARGETTHLVHIDEAPFQAAELPRCDPKEMTMLDPVIRYAVPVVPPVNPFTSPDADDTSFKLPG